MPRHYTTVGDQLGQPCAARRTTNAVCATLPAPGVTALWKYKGIYRLNDERVGQWSDVVSSAVTG